MLLKYRYADSYNFLKEENKSLKIEIKDLRSNIEEMKEKNFNIWKDIYENTYKIPLVYETEVINDETDEVVKKYAKK